MNHSYADEVDEEELTGELADALKRRGLTAESWQSGGGVYVVVVQRPDGRSQYWGLAAGTWGGYESDQDDAEIPGTGVVSEIAPTDIDGAAEFIAARMT